MDIVFGSLIGLAWGSAIGYAKFLFIWRPLFKNTSKQQITINNIMLRYGIGMFLNIFALVAAFFSKECLPFSTEFVLIGTALSLVILNRVCPLSKIMNLVNTDEQVS